MRSVPSWSRRNGVAQMKTPAATEITTSAPIKRDYSKKLTDRQQRTLEALLRQDEIWREDIDRIAGASNGPMVIQQLRRMGLDIACRLVTCTDRDGNPCRPGKYRLESMSRQRAMDFLGVA